ncbi:MAG: pyruvate, phosphate dikinase [Nanoarchaeota archaeon]
MQKAVLKNTFSQSKIQHKPNSTKPEKFIYQFDESKKPTEMQVILGNKGAQLAEMTRIGLPVPKGFTITTAACVHFYKQGQKWPAGLDKELSKNLAELEKKTKKRFGDSKNPLLLSIRSGSYVSMPGMMDTILNLGLNDVTVAGLAESMQNKRASYDCYRRFLQMFGDVVMDVPHEDFEHALENAKQSKGYTYDTQLTVQDLKALTSAYKEIIRKSAKKDIPQDVHAQLNMAIDAVFRSWNTKRAITYRRINSLPDDAGTAVNVQEMVFGNLGDDSATGVSFTRNPSTGAKEYYGEYLLNAQGEDVVAGIRTPKKIVELRKDLPKAYAELEKVYHILEKHYKEIQDFEFTIEKGKLFLLQTRNGKRTAHAAIKIAVDMEKEGLINKKTAVLRVKPGELDQVLHKQLDSIAKKKATLLAKGLPASPGAAVGKVVFTAEEAHEKAKEGIPVILVRTETSPEDIEGMNAAKGILTARGGMTSHAAVVARGMGKCCVAGCEDIIVDEKARIIKTRGKQQVISKEHEWLSLDGSTGEVFLGQVPLVEPTISGEFATLMSWADSFRKLKVRTNADIPRDAEVAMKYGAEGIGLCRTEHMFFEGERIKYMRQMILADDLEGRKKALGKLLPFQRDDFIGLFKAMKGKSVTIRLIDPPLHEFLPQEEKHIKEISAETGVPVARLKEKIASLHEFNPMLGHRGCRLTITYPEIAEMQVRAILSAAIAVKKQGMKVLPEIMVPLVGHTNELKIMKELILRVGKEVMQEEKTTIEYMIGTMIEVPRGALTADEIALDAEFFSFGTNDLTQMTFGFSRDDAGKFLGEYVDKKILPKDPFQVLDEQGVGLLMKMAVEKGRSVKKNLKIGICGEHGGNPQTIMFCHKVGLDYVSCSPYRVPIARLAAAHAALKKE